MANVLIIDDDPTIRGLIAQYAKQLNHQPAVSDSISEGLEISSLHAFDLIFIDVRLPDGNGLDALSNFKALASEPEVIMITGVGDPAGAERAIKNGAWDYIQKPFSKQEIILQIVRALEFKVKKSSSGKVLLNREKIIGSSAQLNSCLNRLAQCAGTDAAVLLTGETGTGKELFARTIHQNSARANSGFVVVDCSTLPEKLIESILFGHVKGAFTGAEKDRAGLIRQADGGTLFLDEIGELPMVMQKTFLRLLQEKSFRPVGGGNELQSDFRLISATNRRLDMMIKDGLFRKDLYYRLRSFHIHLPPLRSRPKDISDLTKHFIVRICEKNRLNVKGFVPEVLEYLCAYDWPGNVRELIHTIETAVFSDPGSTTLHPMHLSPEVRLKKIKASVEFKKKTLQNGADPINREGSKPDFGFFYRSRPQLKEYRDEIIAAAETQYLTHLLSLYPQNVKRASRVSGLSLTRFYTLLRKHRIPIKPF